MVRVASLRWVGRRGCFSGDRRSPSRAERSRWRVGWCLAACVAALCALPAAGEEPDIFYFTPDLIARFQPGTGSDTIVIDESEIGASIRWMQLVPALNRIFWREHPETFRSATPDGDDIRPEFGVVSEFGVYDGVIGPFGEKIYYYDNDIGRFARVNLDGTAAEDLGFGMREDTYRAPGIDPTGEWLYFTALQDDPGMDRDGPFYSIFRGHIETGVVEELIVTEFGRGGLSMAPPQFEFRFDPQNGLIHAFGNSDQFGLDYGLYQLDAATGAVLGELHFEETTGLAPIYTFDPAERVYYYMLPEAGPTIPNELLAIPYEALSPPPTYAERIALSTVAYQFRRRDPTSSEPDRRVTPSGVAHEPAIVVPEPSRLAGQGAGLATVLGVVALRRRLDGGAIRSRAKG
jgi:hypothetical protein